MSATASTSDREIVITRVVDAPRERVFEAFTTPEQVSQWWGPNGFTTTTHEMDARPGGIWRFIMHGPNGTDYPNRIQYIEVVPPERLVYDHDDDVDNDPHGFHVTVTFDQEGAGTRITMRTLLGSAEERKRVEEFGAIEGGNQTLARLAEFLAQS